MAAPHNVEFEAAKFLQKLIHESTDEPAKLATKLYVILQHMKASGKENSMPYQVISRAMETVINQHGLDIDALMSSRVPLVSGSHSGDGARAQAAGCSQSVGVFADSKSGMTENDPSRTEGFASSKPPAAPSSMGHDPFQGSASQRSTRSFDQESPSSIDTRSTNSQSQDRRETAGWEQQGSERDSKRGSIKRKRSDTPAVEAPTESSLQSDALTGIPDTRKERLIGKGEMPGTFPGCPSIESPAGKGPADSEYWKQGFIKGTAPNFRERPFPGHLVSTNQGDAAMTNVNSTTRLDASGMPHMPMNSDRLLQGGNPSNVGEMNVLRSAASRDMGKSPAIQASVSSMPFREHHLKQLRAQCLVFLAFRNGLPPKRLHLEIALGNTLPKEDGAQSEPSADQGKHQTTPEVSSATDVTPLQGNMATVAKNERVPTTSVASRSVPETDTISKETENANVMEMNPGPSSDTFIMDDEKKHLSGRGILEPDMQNQPGGSNHVAYVTGVNKQLKPEAIRWTGIAHNDPSRSLLSVSLQQDLGNRKESSLLPEHESSIRVQQYADSHLSTSWKAVNGMDSDYHRQVAVNDANLLLRNASHDKSLEVEEEDNSLSGLASSPKYTLSERWIMAHQKRKFATEQKWVNKVQKSDERIVARFNELKETVTSSEDISAKTKSVIELKKLQLLELQRRLRRNMLSDFFKPIQTEMDRLKSIKKHRIGRRLKHVEKYEQKMKEERQKRIRERQKEFFSEIEVHRERLEDAFKFKRERCKGFNRYVKEFHKRKERIHREKIDRIQREKINLLKINDVEGYLRMVQDAKSDRVNKLLKETEKYLQKLGSKLKEAKSMARQVEMDENRIAAVDDSIDTSIETEDESDQAKHYKESNEKYYLIAHSIKENITEQPSGLVGGKLREYQMNGLRWLLSLYNNHLNGILADEMGLGKTVQVISLLCYLMENKNDRGPFLVVVPSSVLPGWAQEMSFWAPGISKIVYAGPPEDRRRLFKENIVHQKFNVLLTTYEYLMNKHDRPKLSKVHWHYIIIDEGHRIKNASCKLNADLKHYHSTHRLLLTGTPLQNNLEELWALLNFLLPNIFNSSEDFSQWFNKPFESNGDNSADQALLSEEENLLIINRLHQVLRPFVLRRLKHKVENQLPEKIERLVRCEASAYQKLLMKRVEENLGALGVSKARAVHNSVMELRNICNHPYISQLHADQVDSMIPKHYLPPIVRLCGKLEMLDRLLPKLKATNHRVLLFSTMTRLLDVMEEYLVWKQYRYLRLDGHTSGLERGALIDKFNNPNSPFFIFLLSIRAGGVGVNLQAADTVIIFDTDWNPQVDLQAQARAHRIGQKKDVLVLRLETVHTVEEQVRAAAEHKLGVANQSITAGFFDNNTSAEDRREYLESLLRESKKEEAAPVLDDDGLNDILARSESEIDVFEAIDQKRREEEMVIWQRLMLEQGKDSSENIPPLPSRLVTDDDLKVFYEAMKAYEASNAEAGSSTGMKRKGHLGGFDTEEYGRGKRAREVRSYEEQLTEEEFEKMCQADSPSNAKPKEEQMDVLQPANSVQTCSKVEELPSQTAQALPPALVSSLVVKKEATPPVKRGRGRPRRTPIDTSSSAVVHSTAIGVSKPEAQKVTAPSIVDPTGLDSQGASAVPNDITGVSRHVDAIVSPSSQAVSPLPGSVDPGADTTPACTSIPYQPKRLYRKGQSVEKNIQGHQGAETVRRRGRKPSRALTSVPSGSMVQDPKLNDQSAKQPSSGCAAVVTAPTQSSNSLAESSGALLPKSSDGSNVEDSKCSELPVKQALAGVPSMTVSPPGDAESCKSNVLPQGIVNASVEEAGAGTTVCDLKPQEKSDKQISLDASVSAPSNVSKGDLLSQGQGASVSESSSALVSGIIPAKAGAELHAISQDSPIASSESSLPGSTELRSGRKQNQKPQSGIEPVRRRGRKRGQPLSKAPEPPVVQDLNSNELLKSTASTVNSTVTLVISPSGAVHVRTGSHATVSVVPAVPVAGFMPVSTPLAGVSGSMHHLSKVTPNISATSQPGPLPSGTPEFPSQIPVPQAQEQCQKGQVGEPIPRRRGRRKSTVSAGGPNSTGIQDTYSTQSVGKGLEVVERKVIATRSRQINVSQPMNAQDKADKGGTSAALASKDSKIAVSSNLSSTTGQSRDLHLVPSPTIGGSAPVKTNEANKCLGSGHPSLMEDVKLNCNPANLPPVSSRGVTNVIVLALESTVPSVDDSGISVRTMPAKEECSGLRKDRNSDHSVLVLRPDNVTSQLSCDVGSAILEEEMCAPPGFDTPRSSFLDATVKKSLQSDDTGISKSHDAKTSPVVLALESATLEVGPGSVASQRNESRTIGNSAQGSGHLSQPQGSQLESGSAAEMMATGQLEEEILAPPGFDIPQQSLSETAVAKSLQSHDGLKKQHDPDNSEVIPDGFTDIGSDKTLRDVKKVSKGISEPPRSSSLASSSSCIGLSQPLESESMASLDNLLTIGSDSADIVKESIALVEEESLPPGFATSQASLVQDKNDKPCESKESPMRVESFPSKDPTDSESERIRGKTLDLMQTEKAPIVAADVPMVESEQNMAVGDNFNIQKDESSVDTGESQLCLGASVSKLDDGIGSIIVAAVSVDVAEPCQVDDKTTGFSIYSEKDCTPSRVQLGDDNKRGHSLAEKSVEDYSNVMEPLAKSPISPACLDGQASDNVGPQKPAALASLLVPEDDGSIELTVLSTEDSGFRKENANNWDAFEETNDGNERQTDHVTVVADPIEEIDAATSIETASISNEASKKTQLEKIPALESVLKPADDANTALEPIGNETQGDTACEAQVDSGTVVTYQIKEPDASTLIEENITVLASIHNEAAEKTQLVNPPALVLVSQPEVDANTELSDGTKTDSAHEPADPVTVAAEIGNVCQKDNAASELDIDSCNFVADPIKSVDNCPKENEEFGNAFRTDDAGCEMDIDSHNEVVDATELADDTNLPNPDACEEKSAQNLFSAGNNETMSAGSIQSHMAFTDSGKDGECHENRNDFNGTQTALSVEASDVRNTSVSESTLEEKVKGSGEDGAYHEKQNDFGATQITLLVEASDVQVASVFKPTLEEKETENSLAVSEELIEESTRSDDDDQVYTVSCDKQLGVDATLFFQNTSSEQVDTDARTYRTGKEVEEPKRAAGVDQTFGTSCDVEQNLDGGGHAAIILQQRAAEEVAPCQAGSVENLEDLDHAEESAGILDGHLSLGSPKSIEIMKESSDLVEEDFSKPGLAASQTSLVQDENYKPCESKEIHIPVERASMIHSEFDCIKNNTHDNMQIVETASVAADIPLVESGEKLALSENLNCQKDASSVIDADKGEACIGASHSELDGEKGNINVPAASENVAEPRQGNDETPVINNSGLEVCTPNVVQLGDDHRSASTSEMAEKPAEPGSNLTTMIENPSSPVCLDDKAPREMAEQAPTLASVSYLENDEKTTVSVMESKDLECLKEDATEPRDGCQAGDSAHEKESVCVSVVTSPKKETDSVEESIAVSTSLSDGESAEITPPKTPLAVGSVSEPGDDLNATLAADSVMGVECLKCPEENVKTVDDCRKDDAACEMDIDSHNCMAGTTKENIGVGDACQKGDFGCEMDIDFHNVEADVAAPISDTALSTPETCNAGSAQDVLSVRSNETRIGEPIESHMALREYGKDGASDGKQSDFGGTQIGSSIEGPEVKVVSVYKSVLEEKVGETDQKDGSSSEIPEAVNVGDSAPLTSKMGNSDDGKTSDASISVLEVIEEVKENMDDGLSDIPYVVHAGECAPSTSKLDNSDVDTQYDSSNAVTEATEPAGEKVDDGSSVIPDAVHIGDSVPINLEQASCDDGKTNLSSTSVSEAKELVDGNVGVTGDSEVVAVDSAPSTSKLDSESDESKINFSSVSVTEALEQVERNAGETDINHATEVKGSVPPTLELDNSDVGKTNDSSITVSQPIVDLVEQNVEATDVGDAVDIEDIALEASKSENSDDTKTNDTSISITEATEEVEGNVGATDEGDAEDSVPAASKLGNSDETKTVDSSIGINEATEQADRNVGATDFGNTIDVDDSALVTSKLENSDEAKIKDSTVIVAEVTEQVEGNVGPKDVDDSVDVEESVPGTPKQESSDANDSKVSVPEVTEHGGGNVRPNDVGDAVDVEDSVQGTSKQDSSDEAKANDLSVSVTEVPEQVEGNVEPTDVDNAVDIEDSVQGTSKPENPDKAETNESSVSISEATETTEVNAGQTDLGQDLSSGNTP